MESASIPWRCRSFLSTVTYVSFFAQLGAAGRILVGELFSGNCAERQPNGSLSWIPCVTANGTERHHGGALFKDLPANMIGCFVIGLLSSGATLRSLRPRRNSDDRPVAAVPWYWTPVQDNSNLTVGLRTGFCGSLTTFASWKLQMIRMLVDGELEPQWLGVTMGLLIGTTTAMASLVAGQHLAIALSSLSNAEPKNETDGRTNRRVLTVVLTGLCLAVVSSASTAVIKFSGTVFWRKFFGAVLLAPLGALVRWQLASLNRISWFPIGTFSANMLACLVSFAAQGVENRWTLDADYRLLLFSLRTGFAGALSTVSTWVVEIQALMQDRLERGYLYLVFSQICAVVLGLIVLGCFVWI